MKKFEPDETMEYLPNLGKNRYPASSIRSFVTFLQKREWNGPFRINQKADYKSIV
jgi:hypothetical protein